MPYPEIELSGVSGRAKAHAANAIDAMIISKTGSLKVSLLLVFAMVRRITTTGFAAVTIEKSSQRLVKFGDRPDSGARRASRAT
jgi:hypothetical protein